MINANVSVGPKASITWYLLEFSNSPNFSPPTVKTFIEVNGVDVPYVISPRRDGDIAACYADASKAKKELGWSAEKTVVDMCRDSWNFVKNNK